MKKLFFVLVLSIFIAGCKKDDDDIICIFHEPGDFIEPEYPLSCDTCYFSYKLFDKQYKFLSTDLTTVESVICPQDDTCSFVVNTIEAPESITFVMQRLEKQDSLGFFESFGKKIPLLPVDSIYWGQRMMSASFELSDNCNNKYPTTGNNFPDENFIIIDTAILISIETGNALDIYYYNITGSFDAEVFINNNTENVVGQFSVPKKLVVFHE